MLTIQKMGLSFLILFVLLITAISVQSCKNETDCQEGYSCFDNTCKKCLQCSLLLRKGKHCVVDFNECGDCLEGFEEIEVTYFSTAIKPCKPVKEKLNFKECTNNNNCPPNSYCNEESCIKCFNCSLVNKLPPVGNCAKGFHECGSCMDGFHDIAVTTDTNSKPCVKMNSFVRHEMIQKYVSLTAMVPLSLLAVTFLVFILFTQLRHYRGHRLNKSISQGIQIAQPSAPPLCALDAPQVFRDCREVDSSFINFERETKQQAKVFKQPDASYYWREESTYNSINNDQISENNEDLVSRSLDANRSQPVESQCYRESFTHGFIELCITDSTTDSFPQESSDIGARNNGSASVDLVSLEVVDAIQVNEDSVNETSDTVPIVQSMEEREM